METQTFLSVLAVMVALASAAVSADLLVLEENFTLIAAASVVTMAVTMFFSSGKKKVYVYLEGIETAVPRYQFTQEEATQIMYDLDRYGPKDSQLLERDFSFYKRLFTASTVKTRNSCVADFNLPEAERTLYRGDGYASFPNLERNRVFMDACRDFLPPQCRKLMEKLGKTKDDIGKVITATSTGFYGPGLPTILVDELGLHPTTSQTNIAVQGCAGQGPAFGVAKDWCEANPGKSCLLVAVDLCSICWGAQSKIKDSIGYAIFGDGAGIAIITGSTSAPKSGQWQILDQKTHLIPDSREGITLYYGENPGCALDKCLPGAIEKNLTRIMDPVLAANGTSAEDLAFWIIHPGGPKIILACEAAYNLPAKKVSKHSWGVLADYGNMIAASTLFIAKRTIEEAEQTGKTGKCCLVAFAPGVTAEFVIFERH